MQCEDGHMKLELKMSEDVDELECPTVIQPVIDADVSAQTVTRRQSSRTVNKRSLLLPGELDDGAVTRVSKNRKIPPHPDPTDDDFGGGNEVTISREVEVKPEASLARKKRTYHRRKSQEPSMDESRLSAYCGTEELLAAVGEDCNSVDEILASAGDGIKGTISRVVEVKPEDLLPMKKRVDHRRKPREPCTDKNAAVAVSDQSGSVDDLLGQLMSAYCGNDGHPANCQDCKNRVEAIRALLQSSGKCSHDTSASDSETAAVANDNIEEHSSAKMASAGLFSCVKCSDRFDTFDEWQKHDRTHAAGTKQCTVCNRYLASHTSLISHMRTHTGEKPFRCEDCGASFAVKKTLQEHRFKHTGIRRHQCMYCQHFFARKSTLKIHLRRHRDELPYVCAVCSKAFVTSYVLKRHMETHSAVPVVRKKYARKPPANGSWDQIQTCPDCGKTLSGRSSMKAHRFLHTGARPFVCTVCSKSFTKYQHLMDHSATHTGSKPHVCEQCGARFSRQYSLKVHYRIHTGENPHACELCGVAYAQASSLLQHIRSHHTQDKPYCCSFCGKQFAWAKSRIQHEMRHHTHVRPFHCDICGWQGLTKYSLQCHQQSRHSDEEVKPQHFCSHCSESFVKKSSLKQHMHKHFQQLQNEEPSVVEDEEPACDNHMASDNNESQSTNHEATRIHPQHISIIDKPAKMSIRVSSGYECPHCQLSFATLAMLSRHVRTHFGVPESGDGQSANKTKVDLEQS